LTDAVEEGLIERNPVLHASSRKLQRSRRAQRLSANPLRPDEVARFLENVPGWYRDFYTVWFHTGWRSSEIVAIRFGWLDFRRQTVTLKRGRMPRLGGLEAEPKTGPRSGLFVRSRNLRCLRAPSSVVGRDRAGGLRFHQPSRASAFAGIFRHYRRWIPGLKPGAGDKIGAFFAIGIAH
jgi:integrase